MQSIKKVWSPAFNSNSGITFIVTNLDLAIATELEFDLIILKKPKQN